MKETEKAYIAGIIDGEGCISITRYTRKSNGRIQYLNRLIIGNTNKYLLEWIVAKTGLGRVRYRPHSETESKKAAYDWEIWASGIMELLPQVKPYLVIKKRHAELILESIDLRKLAGRGRGKRLTDEDGKKRDEIIVELSRLNKRGPI